MEYAMQLTYRQISCLWERYWTRKAWDIEVSMLSNPLSGGSKDEDGDTIDASTDEGLEQLKGSGFPIKYL